MKVNINKVSWEVQSKKIIKSVDLTADKKGFIGLVGPNGSGKSSLLRLIYRYYTPKSGVIQINEEDISKLGTKELARRIAVVSQERNSNFNYTVYEIVMMGRIPHKRFLDSDTIEDEVVVRKSLKRVGMLSYANRDFRTLSGGEKQRALIALALAQDAKIILLDEPTNHLDLRYQFEIMELMRSLKKTIIIATHNLGLASSYCDKIYLLKSGKVISSGKPKEVLTAKRIKDVYKVPVKVEFNYKTNQLSITPIGK